MPRKPNAYVALSFWTSAIASVHEPPTLLQFCRASITSAEAAAGITVIEMFLRLDLAKTKSEVRRLIKGGGAKLNDEKIADDNLVVGRPTFDSEGELKLSSGKKKHGIIFIE